MMNAKKPLLLARERGFCAGVRAALKCFDDTLQSTGAPLYVLHELVHNRAVTRDLTARGAVFVESVENVPENATLLFGAHGVPKSCILAAEKRNVRFVDATCPLVARLQRAAGAVSPERDLLLFGSENHPEMQGVKACAGTDKIHFISRIEEVDDLPGKLTRPVLLSQTTRNRREIDEIRALLKTRYPDLEDHAGVCNAVSLRQEAVREMAARCDVVLVAGSPHSSNALRLKEIAEECGARAFLLDDDAPLPEAELTEAGCVGVASGASTPESSVEKIIAGLHRFGYPPPEEKTNEN
ncbi:MAG: 4-hydroxy-3-methylbut-2-enyl diphosphate reductase [Victivallaceae bacterium]|nr:4-hydroxy-3-methylbut-2-enyl diphosphate reductase [Victivallaceae bacterium]